MDHQEGDLGVRGRHALTRALHQPTGWALERSICLDGLSVVRPSLEDAYLQLTRLNPPRVDDPPAGPRTQG